MNNLWKWLDLGTGTSDENLKEQKFSEENYITYVVRESVQNSVDAWRKHYVDREDEQESNPALIKFKFSKSEKDLGNYFSGLIEARQTLDASGEFGSKYKDNLNFEDVDWFTIQDLNTGGILGDLTDRTSDFWNFLLNWGRSNKLNEKVATGGSKGVGRITFPQSSRIKSVFNVTRRPDGLFTSGFALLNSGRGDPGNRLKEPYALFADEELKDDCVWTLHDISKEFIKDFKLTDLQDDSQTGTAIIIPFPQEELTRDVLNSYNNISASLIENYAPLIIRGNLKPTVGDQEINFINLLDTTKKITGNFDSEEFRDNGHEFIEFCVNSIDKLEVDEEFVEINLDKACKLEDWHMEEELKTSINKRLEANEIITFKINFPVVLNDEEKDTFIELSFQKPSVDENGRMLKGLEVYYRNGMSMKDIRKRVSPDLHAVLFTRDNVIGNYLGLFENASHTIWTTGKEQREKALDSGYNREYYQRPVKLCLNSIMLLFRKFIDEQEVVDEQIWSNFFSLPEALEKEIEDDKGDITAEGDDEVDVEERDPEPWTYNSRAGGFTLKHRKNSSIPKNGISIKAAYKSESMLAAVKYANHDFDLSQVNFKEDKCKATGQENRIFINDLKKDFTLNVSGLDSPREMELTIEIIK